MPPILPAAAEEIRCPACGVPDAVVLLSGLRDRFDPRHRYRIARCRSCKIRMTHPTRDSYPRDYEPYLDSEEAPRPSRLHAAIVRAFYERRGTAGQRLALFLPYLAFRAIDWMRMRGRDLQSRPFRKHGRLLDVGSGGGQMLDLWRSQHDECIGVEPNAAAAMTARTCRGLDVRAGTLEEQGFPAAGFDVITLCHVLEHVESPPTTLNEVARLLRPGGEVLIWVPNFHSLLRPILGPAWLPYDVPRHRWHFSARDVVRLLQQAGLRPTEVAYDPNEWAFRTNLGGVGTLVSILLKRSSAQTLVMLGCRWFRRTDVVRVRARKA